MDKIYAGLSLFFATMGFIALAFIFAIIEVWLWNNVFITLFNGVNPITFWKMVGMNILLGIFFGGSSFATKIKK